MKTIVLLCGLLLAVPAFSAATYPAPTQADIDAAFPDMAGMDMHDDMGGTNTRYQLMFDRLENRVVKGVSAQSWEGQAWWGSDLDKAWLRSEGERRAGSTGELSTELYWNHAAAAWWDSQLGLRQDSGPGPGRSWLALGVQGQSPYFFHVGATVFAGDKARTALRLQAEDDWLLRDRLILQPRLELNGYGQADPERGIVAGFSDRRLGLRLRYELRRELAPYMGLEWRQGRSVEDRGLALVMGVRGWL